jgi:hypothetical protein
MNVLSRFVSFAVPAAVALNGCNPTCATYVVSIVVEDQASGNLLCDGHVRFFSGDAGMTLDASTAYSDAEIPASSSICQWDIVVSGGSYHVTATAPGFKPGTATLQLQADECGEANAPVTIYLVRS